MEAWLRQNPPRRDQYRSPRRAKQTGCTVLHTAENVMDTVDLDTGAEGVCNFIRNRTSPGSYHDIADSDSSIKVVRYSDEAYQDGTGSNPWAMSISFALRTTDWATMDPARRAAFLRQGALAFARQQAWLKKNGLPTTPLRRISKAQSAAGVAGFVTHGDRDPGRRSDPGVNFPWEEWFEACRVALAELGQPVPPPPPPPPPAHDDSGWIDTMRMPVLRRGSTAFFHVTGWQGWLKAQQLLAPEDVDGQFGPKTERATKELQRRRGLPQTGVVDKETWDQGLQWKGAGR